MNDGGFTFASHQVLPTFFYQNPKIVCKCIVLNGAMLKKNPNMPNLHIIISKSEDRKSLDLGQNPTLWQQCSLNNIVSVQPHKLKTLRRLCSLLKLTSFKQLAARIGRAWV